MNPAGQVHQEQTFRPRLAPALALGWYGVAAFGGYDLVRRGDGRQVSIGLTILALITVVVYATAQRPAVVAGARGVLLRNVIRDVWLPWHLVKGIESKWSLAIETADASYGSWALTGGNARRGAPEQLEQLRRRGLHGERAGEVEVRPAWPVIAGLGVTIVVLVLLLSLPGG